MYRSLLPVLNHHIKAGSSGILSIVHYSSDQGKIFLNSGKIVRLTTADLQGVEAARKIFSWLSYLVRFESSAVNISITPQASKHTEKIINHLAKVDAIIHKIRKNIVGCETVLLFDRSAIEGVASFTPEELQISLAINGSQTIEQVLIGSDLPELRVLMILSRFVEKGLAKIVSAHEPIPADEINRRITALTDVLLDITGPVAEILVDDVCGAMGIPRDHFCESDYRQLLSFIKDRLDEDERHPLDAWIRRV